MANVGERERTIGASAKYSADVGERPRTVADGSKVTLKTTRVQALGGSNPSPSAKIRIQTARCPCGDDVGADILGGWWRTRVVDGHVEILDCHELLCRDIDCGDREPWHRID